MINYSEENAVKLSATKKDFYQIWNELLETASKISERWDPTSTNESDPGIVLLKVLTAVADKLNYNIDVNALEAFMPSAAQEESMRKLTEMLGYNMKYYQSATTEALITYNKSESDPINTEDGLIFIDKFTNLKDIDDTVNYVTLHEVSLNADMTSVIVPVMEGELVECETEDDNIISLLQLDDNNRYYLPEVQIAENGIFVTNVNNSIESDNWVKVNNLNTQRVNYKCYKFGYDSRVNLPYIQFPDDINNIIEDGLKIKYLRTNGIKGNISAKTLYKMEKPASWQVAADGETSNSETSTAAYLDPENYSVSNTAAAKNGSNIESITDAYNNFKKTIGTFDTLVTCRDYMNKIYQLTISKNSTTPLVSNIIVSDIRDDINKANTLCTFGPYGIEYNNIAKEIDLNSAEEEEVADWNRYYVGNEDAAKDHLNELFRVYKINPDYPDGKETLNYYRAVYDGNYYTFEAINTEKLTHFDLVFYPFKNIYGLNSKLEYTKSFKYDDSPILEIKEGVAENKTIAHNIILPNKDDIACIKNYFNLKASVTTTRKVNYTEQKAILANINAKLFEAFNMRKVDFGEEIPYDDILRVMENADPRIKNVSLEDPVLETKFCTVEGGEFAFAKNDGSTSAENAVVGNYYYNKMALNNVLAGRIPLFNYDENFKPEYNEAEYPSWIDGTGHEQSYEVFYPEVIDKNLNGISYIKSEFWINNIMNDIKTSDIKIKPNEVVQFRLPNLRTLKTYPAYVNYFLHLETSSELKPTIPATMRTLLDFLDSLVDPGSNSTENYWDKAANDGYLIPIKDTTVVDTDTFDRARTTKYELFWKDSTTYKRDTKYVAAHAPYYYLPIEQNNLFTWDRWIKSIVYNAPSTPVKKLTGLYVVVGTSYDYNYGYLVDNSYTKYKPINQWTSQTDPFKKYYVQLTHDKTLEPGGEEKVDPEDAYTEDGLGQNGNQASIAVNEEYKLKPGEYLLINYTSSTSTEGSNKTIINEAYTAGTIIKPSFELVNSYPDYRELHSYSKTTGFGPFTVYGSNILPDGMFTLGTNEQIEIRDFVIVDLDKDYTNIYWTRNDEVVESNDRIYFNFNEEPVYTNGIKKGMPVPADTAFDEKTMEYTAYTLKDGEYFYYTNKDKLDIAYYGAGTKIKKTIYTPDIFKSKFDNEISAEDINTYGLSAAIPWKPYTLGAVSATQQRKLTLTEYQYITLAGGSTLISFETDNPITNAWQNCAEAYYQFADEEGRQSLPSVNLGDGISWEVRSKLELNVGPNLIQQLYTTADNDLNTITADSITLYQHLNKKEVELVKIEPHNGNAVAIKANKLIQSTTDITDTSYTETTEDGYTSTKYDCQIKVFELADLRDVNNNAINLNNFGEGTYTKLSFGEDDVGQIGKPFTSFRAIVPGKHFGLLMIYNNKVGESEDNAGIRIINSYETTDAQNQPYPPVICNYLVNGNEAWWDNQITTNADFFATEGKNLSGISEVEFEALRSTLYIKTLDPQDGSDSDSDSDSDDDYVYKLHTYEVGPGGVYYYKYTKVKDTDQYNQYAYYCQLLDEGNDGDGKLYRLRKGINIVKINKSGILQIFPDGAHEDILIISPLDLVYANASDEPESGKSKAINPKLCYKAVDDGKTIYDQIMADILVLDPDHQFYYNALMNNETALDLNANDPNDTLENPLNWYNYNNMNNKFVVSEINADYLSTGIVIARNSKL